MAITKDALKNVSIEDALAMSYDEVPDLGFKAWAHGTYHVVVGQPVQEEVAGKQAIKVPYTLKEIIEIDEETGAVPAEAAENQLTYFLPSGIANIKQDWEAVNEVNGWTNSLQTMEGIAGIEVAITLSTQKDRNDATKIYQRVKAIKQL